MTRSSALAVLTAVLLWALPHPAAEAHGDARRDRDHAASGAAYADGDYVADPHWRRNWYRARSNLYVSPVVVGSGCDWLRSKAGATRDRAWLARYRECRGWD